LKCSISDKSDLRIKKLMDTLNNALGQEVGSVVTAVNNVKAIDKNGNVRELDQGAPVFRGDTIETGHDLLPKGTPSSVRV
jgi:hypothetical protein